MYSLYQTLKSQIFIIVHRFYGNESHYLTHKEPVKWVKLANQLTGFYMRATLALNGLNYKYVENNRLSFYYQY